MPGALIIGCDAGTLNMPKIKGSHTAMKSGMIAAETINEHITENKPLSEYEDKFKKSWIHKKPSSCSFSGISQISLKPMPYCCGDLSASNLYFRITSFPK